MELSQNIWARYGFQGNPFDTGALSAAADALLPVADAIVGREMSSSESQMLLNIVRNPGGGRAVVEGEIGIGKTTFVNYHRYLWEVEAQDKLLTPAMEISLSVPLTVREFINNIMGAVLGKMILVQGEKYVHGRPLLHELYFLNRVFIHRSLDIQATVLGVGGGVGRAENVTIPEQPSDIQMIDYLRNLVDETRQAGYNGLFLHFDNLELMSLRHPDQTQHMFEDLRDVLQIPGIYYVFVGQKGFFSEVISPSERVRSVFSGFPVFVPPLSLDQILEAVSKRYILLASGRFIRPVEDDLIAYLYDLYDGKVRFVMDAVTSIVSNLPYTSAETLDTKAARSFLVHLVIERLKRELTRREMDILREAVPLGQFTNASIARALHVKRPNVTKYLKTLQDRRFIYAHHRKGRQIFYCVSEDVRIIRDVPDASFSS